jgi:hypothetical protein
VSLHARRWPKTCQCQHLRIIWLPAHSLFFSIRLRLTHTSTSTEPQTDPPLKPKPILVRKPLTNFNNAFDSRDKCVPVGIGRLCTCNGGAGDGALGRERGHKVTTIIQAFKPLFKLCVFIAQALFRCQLGAFTRRFPFIIVVPASTRILDTRPEP